MHYDAVIIGAGMSGLAAGIRLAYFDRRVCIVDKHYAYGGLNSYYTLDGRAFDVGLHAITNFAPDGVRNAPLAKLLRQLRLTREELALHPQGYSEVHFPDRRLRFTNDIDVMTQSVADLFPSKVDNFCRLTDVIREFDDLRLDATYQSTRAVLAEYIGEPVLIEMLLCPLMYYGSPEQHDMDFTQFVTMFKAIFLEGFARPRAGVRGIIRTLVKKFRSCGGKLMMRNGVEQIQVRSGRVTGLTLESGEELTADQVFSSAGYHETMRLCDDAEAEPVLDRVGQVSFVETIAVLDELPQRLGHGATIVFFNDGDEFNYAVPGGLIDPRSGVLCCPSNYEGHDDMAEGVLRVTWLASYDRWAALDKEAYAAAKRTLIDRLVERAEPYVPGIRERIVYTDAFTPLTIKRFTGHENGAVYGAPDKRRDGRTRLENLFICGTDQGYLGIIGAMLSGISMANLHGLSDS